jgi:hypothetical protein
VTASVFVNAGANDYRLVGGSFPVDAGVALHAVTTDRNGVRRPVNGRWDIGAYEFPPSAP